MTAYAWPFPVNHFEMQLQPNLRVFTGPYTPTTQTLDLLGERWSIILDMTQLPASDRIAVAAREAFFDRLMGSTNSITIGHLWRKLPLGTLRGPAAATWVSGGAAASWVSAGSPAEWISGDPVIASPIAQLANTCFIQTLAGRTLLAGDHFGVGGQLVRVMADTEADGSGLMPVEFYPRARTAIAAGAAVLWDYPTAEFILKPGTLNVPTAWTPDQVDGATVELIEIF